MDYVGDLTGLFLDILKKTQPKKTLKTEAVSHENSSKISEKLRIRPFFFDVFLAFED